MLTWHQCVQLHLQTRRLSRTRLPWSSENGTRPFKSSYSFITCLQTPVTFEDVAGVDEAKEELKEIVVGGWQLIAADWFVCTYCG